MGEFTVQSLEKLEKYLEIIQKEKDPNKYDTKNMKEIHSPTNLTVQP
jgi:hypothetical protein